MEILTFYFFILKETTNQQWYTGPTQQKKKKKKKVYKREQFLGKVKGVFIGWNWSICGILSRLREKDTFAVLGSNVVGEYIFLPQFLLRSK